MAEKRISSLDVTANNLPLCTRGTTVEYWDGERFTKGFEAKYSGGSAFSPRKMLLQNRSERLLLLSPDRKNTIVTYDTATGSPLRNFTVRLDEAAGVEASLDNITSAVKFGELTDNPTMSLKGLAGNRLLNLDWDPRVKQDTIVVTETDRSEINTRGHRFTSIATTTDGFVAAGSADGTVRLFSELGKKAKTSLDQYATGEAVTGVDVSADGEWIIWTTSKFLALAKVGFQGNKGKTTGFETAMGKQNKPDALVIRFSEADLSRCGLSEEDVAFTPARFDRSTSTGLAAVVEEYVVTTTGPFVLQWKLRHLVNDYNAKREVNYAKARPKIIKEGGVVVDKAFEYGITNKVVTALPDLIKTLSLDEEEDE